MRTPFIYGKVATPLNFTDREKELENLKRNIKASNNTILISPRRWGKTSLVKKAIAETVKEDKKYKACHLDIFNITDEDEFYTKFAEGVLNATASNWDDFVKMTKTFLAHLAPQITVTPNSQTKLTFAISFADSEKSADDILNLPQKIADKKKIKVLVCIDEFQSISTFKDPIAFQRKLRSHWQHHNDVSYCLYGSKRHMLLDVFTNPSMPFYKFGDIILLQKIGTEDWIKFITKRFRDTKKKISKKHAKLIADLVDNHPYYVQQLAQQSWFRTEKECNKEIILEAHEAITDQLGLLFSNLTEQLTNYQIDFLRAMTDGVKQLSSIETLRKYNLGSSSNVTRLKESLHKQDIINDYIGDVEFLDPYYAYWLKNRFFYNNNN